MNASKTCGPKQTAHIDNWLRTGNFLCGMVTGHPLQQNFREEYQYTSDIVRMDEEAGICETRNTVYTLGTKRVPPVIWDQVRLRRLVDRVWNNATGTTRSTEWVDEMIAEVGKS